MNFQSYKFVLGVSGLAVGLILPLICILLSSLWDVDGFAYMTFMMPLIFAAFGAVLGFVMDKFMAQKQVLERLNGSLREQSIMDELTGKYNRRHIVLEIDKEIERAKRYQHTLAGIMIDVDDFKKYNDRYGHLFGDYILKEVTAVFDHCIRTIDVLGRYGGDEFIILLPEAREDTAHIVADRIKKAVAAHPFIHKKRPLKVTVSIGVHYFESLANVDKNDFVDAIDKALYQAKNLGKNRVVEK